MSFDQLLEIENNKAARKEATKPSESDLIPLGNKPLKRVPSNFLGPKLFKRFRVTRPLPMWGWLHPALVMLRYCVGCDLVLCP